MNFRKVAFQAIAAAVLVCSTALAQYPAPTPSASGSAAGSTSVDYGLFFNSGLSNLLTGTSGGRRPLNFNPSDQFKDSRGCTVTYATDSDIACFTSSSCSADDSFLPFCALGFTGRPGLTVSDVVRLDPISGSSDVSSAFSRLTVLPSGKSPQAIFEAFRKTPTGE